MSKKADEKPAENERSAHEEMANLHLEAAKVRRLKAQNDKIKEPPRTSGGKFRGLSESPPDGIRFEEGATGTTAKRTDQIQGRNEQILVAEDDECVRRVTSRILKGLGYRVLPTENGKEALEVFKTEGEGIDLAILDLVMPEANGPTTYKNLKQLKPELPIIFVTGYGYHAGLRELEESESMSMTVLHKPYTRISLGKKIREILDSGEALKNGIA